MRPSSDHYLDTSNSEQEPDTIADGNPLPAPERSNQPVKAGVRSTEFCTPSLIPTSQHSSSTYRHYGQTSPHLRRHITITIIIYVGSSPDEAYLYRLHINRVGPILIYIITHRPSQYNPIPQRTIKHSSQQSPSKPIKMAIFITMKSNNFFLQPIIKIIN